MQKLAQGAEAIIYKKENRIIKDRFRKTYRAPEIDGALRTFRTRREAKILEKLAEIKLPAPKLKNIDDNKARIEMDFVQGELVKNIFDKNHKKIAKEIGRKIAILHNNNIIHGDLTTSNMILSSENKEIHLIDFGLSFFSLKAEDKAVDLHLLDRALESKHYKVYPECMEIALNEYKKHSKDAETTLKRYEDVKKRGRYKGKH